MYVIVLETITIFFLSFFWGDFADVALFLLVFLYYFFPLLEEYSKKARLQKIIIVEMTKEKNQNTVKKLSILYFLTQQRTFDYIG